MMGKEFDRNWNRENRHKKLVISPFKLNDQAINIKIILQNVKVELRLSKINRERKNVKERGDI